jgi:hypothetical protein
MLELTLDFAKWLRRLPDYSDAEKFDFIISIRRPLLFNEFIVFSRRLTRLFDTEACLNGSFLSLPDLHFRTSSNNPGIDLDQVIAVMDNLRSCDPKIQQLVSGHRYECC